MASEATKTDDGGPAFPCATDWVIVDTKDNKIIPVCGGGMTLRDYFAGQALAGMLADSECGGTHAEYAKWAYSYADAMISARKAVSP